MQVRIAFRSMPAAFMYVCGTYALRNAPVRSDQYISHAHVHTRPGPACQIGQSPLDIGDFCDWSTGTGGTHSHASIAALLLTSAGAALSPFCASTCASSIRSVALTHGQSSASDDVCTAHRNTQVAFATAVCICCLNQFRTYLKAAVASIAARLAGPVQSSVISSIGWWRAEMEDIDVCYYEQEMKAAAKDAKRMLVCMHKLLMKGLDSIEPNEWVMQTLAQAAKDAPGSGEGGSLEIGAAVLAKLAKRAKV